MLHEFLTANHDELVKRCREKVAKRPAPAPTAVELEHGIPLFIDQLVTTLLAERDAGPRDRTTDEPEVPKEIITTAGKHGNELLLKGFTVDQVVHDYGDLCQAVTELAQEKQAPITVDEFHTLNRCLDNAIAGAVTEFGRQRDQFIADKSDQTMNERLGSIAHELRNKLNTAMLAFDAIKSGSVALAGATGALLERSLLELTGHIDRSLADVRLTAGMRVRRETIALREFLEEVGVFAVMEAKARGLGFGTSIDRELMVAADRQMLSSAVANLLQNALKFTPRGGKVCLRARLVGARVLIEIEDQCGGLPPGKIEELFHPFQQRSSDRTGLGLGLSISRRGVEANGGELTARDLPGVGCIFTIDLPAIAS